MQGCLFCVHRLSKTRLAFGGDGGIVWPCPAIPSGSCTTSTPDSQRPPRKTLLLSGNPVGAAFYPPNCSVILLISLFKSLSVFRVPSILSTEWSTVV